MTNKLIQPAHNCNETEHPEILTVAAARERILASAASISGIEKLALRDTLDRVLAEDIISPVNVPGHTNSAMDGYAISRDDIPSDAIKKFKVVATAYAGKPVSISCGSGECIRIMTGAPMPAGTDTVIMQEQVNVEDTEHVHIGSGHRPAQNVRQAGEDIPKGSIVFESGRSLTPAGIGVLASLGIFELSVYRRPRIAFFSTGDELRSAGESLGEGDVFDSNRYSLYGMLKKLNVDMLDMGTVSDDPAELRTAFKSAANMADVVISSGGVSVGEADYTKCILEEIGDINFWKIAMKPGRPLTFGHLDNALFFGLPGNPVAVMVTFYQFVLPALHYIATGKPYIPFQVQAVSGDKFRKRPGRFEFARGILKQEPDGTLSVASTGQQGSGILTSMSTGNCFILLPEESDGVARGDVVQVQPFNFFGG
jgi:molybdopterin molybdotransferase